MSERKMPTGSPDAEGALTKYVPVPSDSLAAEQVLEPLENSGNAVERIQIGPTDV